MYAFFKDEKYDEPNVSIALSTESTLKNYSEYESRDKYSWKACEFHTSKSFESQTVLTPDGTY
jgi:hypothetical protein